jgi:hypothetical protein
VSDPDPRAALAADARAELVGRLDALLGDRLRLTERRPRDGAGWVDVSAHDLAAGCPARWSVPIDDFVMTASTVAGAVGRLALRERHPEEPPGVAVDRVLRSLDDADRDAAWFADWYEAELDRGGRLAVRSAATTWAVGALAAVGGRRLSWSTRREAFDVPERMVRLRANWDAADRTARPDVLVVMSGRPPSDPAHRLLAAFDALVVGMHRRRMPERVRIGSASTASTVAVPIDAQALTDAIDRIVELVGWRVEPDTAPTAPSSRCADCHLLESCDDGLASVAG